MQDAVTVTAQPFEVALELARHNPVYEDIASKFFDISSEYREQSLHAVIGSRQDLVEKFGTDAIKLIQLELADDVPDEEALRQIREALKGKLIVAGYNRTGDHLDVALVSESLGLGVHDVATETDGMRGLAVATNVDPADVANQDDVHMVATLDGKLIIAGYDRLGDLVRIQETDPINFHIAWDVIEESSMGTAGSPYVYYLDLDSYYRMSLQIDITLGGAAAGGVALTTLGTVEDDDPDLTARVYVDMTNAWTGSASITADAILVDLAGYWGNFTAIKLNVAVVNAANNSAIKIDTKRHVGG
jgi:hypothetical protein